MTAPAPLDLPALLDDLERAHAAGARGQTWGFDALVALKRLGLDADPAALIVAAVNAVPTLITELRKRDAALKAVEALAKELGSWPATRIMSPLDAAARIAAALSPESVPSERAGR